ncbi:MAG: transcriptional regulator [Planctomycetes bacterium]|nr:transcriptional regulator [Planctomycetota bacterium]
MARHPSRPSWHELIGLHEDRDLEYKSARGGLPGSLWETYSAMANTDGGTILLGVEDDGRVSGLTDAMEMRQRFWDTVNNRGKVSTNLLSDPHVTDHDVEGRTVLAIRVPRAGRWERPVYVGQNPLNGTYRRNFDGDYRCSQQEVGRMLADRSEEPADSMILDGFGLDDLDDASVQQYRQRFSARTPDHPWLNEGVVGFLAKLGGWRTERRADREGLTVAGMLMFGKVDAIRAIEAIPEYHVDYRECLSDDPAVRWTDRLTVDGTWQTNLFQFYQRVIQRLSADLKRPFQLDEGLFRLGQTVVHEAIREALVNGLIHADYRGEGGVVVEKYRDRFEVSNPGTLLVSFDQLLRGGVSECRNKALQTMFLMIGAAEKAGSGIDKIRRGWQSQHWRLPSIQEQFQPARVRLVMPMVSLMPDGTLADLRRRFGAKFGKLSEDEVQAVVTAAVEGQVSNERMREVTNKHPADLTRVLHALVQKGFLTQDGQRRWATYRLRGGHVRGMARSADSAADSIHKGTDSIHKADSIHKRSWDSSQMLEDMDAQTLARLRQTAALAQAHRRLSPQETRNTIVKLCSGIYLTAFHLSELMNRSPVSLRSRFLRPLVQEGLLRLRYPDRPNRPDQAYTAVQPRSEDRNDAC